MTCEIINNMAGIVDKSYLELGYGTGENFKKIICREKWSVDVNGKGGFYGTTDEFFDRVYGLRWNIIFIDADHSAEQVRKDYNNSIRFATEWIIIHDLIPPSEKYTAPRFCVDGFRFLYTLLKIDHLKNGVYPMAGNLGMTFIRMPHEPVERLMNISYRDFMEFIELQLRYSENQIVKILNGGWQK